MLIINIADLCTEIGTIIPRILDLLSDNDSHVRRASINALSKLVEHGKIVYCNVQFANYEPS